MEKLSGMSMGNDYFKKYDAYSEYQSTKEGNRVGKLLKALHKIANQFCELHGITCCNRRVVKHSHYQCKYNSDPIIACYREDECLCPDIEQVEKYIAYVGAHEIDSLLDKFLAISHVAREMKGQVSIILQICKKEFSDNVYVKERILAATESTNILQEEEDKNLSLGMPVQPQEDDENISLEEEVCEE